MMPADATVLRELPGRPAALWFWTIAILLDAALLITLPRSPWVLGGLILVTVTVVVVRHPAILLAYLIGGTPLLAPVSDALDAARPVAASGYVLVALFVLLRLWNSLWDSTRFRAFSAMMREPVWRWAVALGLLLWIGLGWTAAPIYGGSKVYLYWLYNMTLISLALLALRRDENEEGLPRTAVSFLRALLWLQIGIALAAVWNSLTGYYPYAGRLTTLWLNPIWLARHVGLGILTALLLNRMGRLSRRVMLPLLALLVWVLVAAGSRGPTLSLLAALAVGYLMPPIGSRTRALPSSAGGAVGPPERASGPSRGRRWVVLFLITLGLVIPLLLLVDSTQQGSGRTVSNQIRVWLLSAARRALGEISFLGFGPGGFSSFLGLPDRRWYPHNLFIEVTLENGVLGLGVLIGFLVAVVAAWRRWGRVPSVVSPGPDAQLRRGVGVIFLFVLLCAQFSGDIYVNDWVWAFAGVIAAWAPRPAAARRGAGRRGLLREGDDGDDEGSGGGER